MSMLPMPGGLNLPPWMPPQVPQSQGLPQLSTGNKLSRLGQLLSAYSGTYDTPGQRTQAVNQLPQLWGQQDMYNQQMQQGQDMYDLKKQKMEYEMNLPKNREMVKGADGHNYYVDTGERVLPGVEAKPESMPSAVREYEFAKSQGFNGSFQDWQVQMANAKKPTNTTNVNLPSNMPYEIEKGYMLKDPNDPSKGVTPIPGGGKDESTAEQAAKVQMLRTAQDAYSEVENLLYEDDGSIDRENLFNAKVGMPFSEGRELGVRMETGIQAITRAETGAAMPETEVENTKKRFMPSPLDSDKTIKLKLELYQDFINGSLKLIDPSGRFDEERFNKELSKRKKNENVPESVIDDLINKYIPNG